MFSSAVGFNPPVGPIRTCTSRANKVTQCRYPLSGDIDTSFKSQLPRCAADQAPEVFPGSRFQGRRLPTRSAPATAKLLRPSPACSARRADPIFSSKLKEPPQWPGLVARQQSNAVMIARSGDCCFGIHPYPLFPY